MMTKYVLKIQLEIPQIPHNLFDPSAQIGQLFGIFKSPHHMSIVHAHTNMTFFLILYLHWLIVSISNFSLSLHLDVENAAISETFNLSPRILEELSFVEKPKTSTFTPSHLFGSVLDSTGRHTGWTVAEKVMAGSEISTRE